MRNTIFQCSTLKMSPLALMITLVPLSPHCCRGIEMVFMVTLILYTTVLCILVIKFQGSLLAYKRSRSLRIENHTVMAEDLNLYCLSLQFTAAVAAEEATKS